MIGEFFSSMNGGLFLIFLEFGIGIGIEKPNNWAFDTTQFDNILKRLKVVSFITFILLIIYGAKMLFGYSFVFCFFFLLTEIGTT